MDLIEATPAPKLGTIHRIYDCLFVFFNLKLVHAPLLCSQDKVAMDLGFYYMANAMGRLVGVLVGGFLYHYTVSLRITASRFFQVLRRQSPRRSWIDLREG